MGWDVGLKAANEVMAMPVHVTLYKEIDKPEAITWTMTMMCVSTSSVPV
jgi:hypothetical protein